MIAGGDIMKKIKYAVIVVSILVMLFYALIYTGAAAFALYWISALFGG